jgi:hypothetical protein
MKNIAWDDSAAFVIVSWRDACIRPVEQNWIALRRHGGGAANHGEVLTLNDIEYALGFDRNVVNSYRIVP